MSRTHQHKPYVYRLTDARVAIEQHNHSQGECDLIPLDEWIRDNPPWRAHRCHWDVKIGYLYTHPVCSCCMCRGYDRRESAKKERRAGKQAIREQVVEFLRGEDD